jgi:RHS repeat-associated protein
MSPEPRISAGDEAARPAGYAFTGREWDPETQLYYYRARYYDPTLGRFIGEDPIGFAGDVNFYSYVRGNPAGGSDPLGLRSYVVEAAHGKYGLESQARALGHIAKFYPGMTDEQIDAAVERNSVDALKSADSEMLAAVLTGMGAFQYAAMALRCDRDRTATLDPHDAATPDKRYVDDPYADFDDIREEMLKKRGGNATRNPDGTYPTDAETERRNLQRFRDELDNEYMKRTGRPSPWRWRP